MVIVGDGVGASEEEAILIANIIALAPWFWNSQITSL